MNKLSITNSTFLKITVGLIAAAFLFMGVAQSAKALTNAECDSARIALIALGISSSTVDSLLASQCGTTEISGDLAAVNASLGEVALQSHPPYVRLGSRGDNVAVYQRALMALGGDLSPWYDDGIFGPDTEGLFRDFQTEQGIAIDGVIGSQTQGSFLAALANLKSTLEEVTTGKQCDDGVDNDGDGLTDFPNDPDCVDADDDDESQIVTAGDLTVTLSNTSPVASVLPDDGYVHLGTISLTGAPGDVLDQVVFTRKGVGAVADWTRMYILQNGNRLTSGSTIATDTNRTEFNNIGLTLDGAVNLELWGDLANGISGSQHWFEIVDASDISTTGGSSVGGAFPIATNAMSIADVTAGTLTMNSGSSASSVSIGEVGAIVEKFTLQATNEDVDLTRITLRQNGSADVGDMANWELYYSTTSTKLADGYTDGRFVIFNLDDKFLIADGNTKSFEVRTDIGTNVNPGTDRVQLEIQRSFDVYAVGRTFGHGVEVTDAHTADNVLIEGGVVTFTDGGPSAKDVKVDANDVVVLSGTLTTAIPVTIQTMDLIIDPSSGAGIGASDLADIRFKNADTGATLVGPINPTGADDTAVKIDLDSDFLVDGTLNWEITVDVANDSTLTAEAFDFTLITANNDTYAAYTAGNPATIDVDLPGMEDNEGNTIAAADIIPSTHVNGETMTINEASLNVGLASTPSGDTYVSGSNDVPLLGVTFKSSDAEDITLEEVTFNGYAAVGNLEDLVSGLRLEDDNSAVVSTTENIVVATDTVTFTGLNMLIPASSQLKLTLMGNLAGSIAVADAIGFDIVGNGVDTDPDAATMTANVVASDEDGNTVVVYDEDGTADAGDWENANLELNDGAAASLAADGDEADADVEIEIATAGTLTMSVDADTPLTNLVAAGSSSVDYTKVKLAAADEAYVVEKLRVINDDFAGEGDDEFVSVTLSYTNSSSNTETKTLSLTSGVADFTGLDIFVPKDDDTIVTIQASMNTTPLGADDAASMAFDIDYNTQMRAVGQSSGTVLTTVTTIPATTNALGNDMNVYEAYPAFAAAGDTPSGDLIPSANTLVAKFTVSTSGGEDITFEGQGASPNDDVCDADEGCITFQISSSGAAVANAAITVTDGATTLCTETSVNTDLSAETEWICDFGTNQLTVPASGSKTLFVYVDTTTAGLTTAGDSISVWLNDALADTLNWSIDGDLSDYNHADIILRGDVFAGSLVKP